MTYDVYVTDKANHQLEAAARWWARHRSVEQPNRWYDGFGAAIRSLAKNTQRFPLAPESDAFPIEIRQILYGSGNKKTHRAVFTIRPDRVVVYTVGHLTQDAITPDDL